MPILLYHRIDYSETSGGMMGTNVGGTIDIRYNDISNYYTGTGIGIDNTNIASAEINIKYNSIRARDVGISLSNTATAGNASYMAAYIAGNDIRADGGSYVAGIAIENEAQPNALAEQFNFIAGNSIAAYGGNATGVNISNAANGSTYYSAVAEQYNLIWSNSGYGNGIYASGNYAVGVAISNSTYYGHAGQFNSVKYNDITAYGGFSATGVQIANNAGVFGYASQSNYFDGNCITPHDFAGISSATGVSLANQAAKYGLAVQGLGLARIKANLLPSELARVVVWQGKRPYFIATAAALGLAALVGTVSACLEEYRATSDPFWYEQAHRAFDWFLGWNDLGLELYSPNTGGCRDALHVDRVNGNQGAESTLAFLLSLAEMRIMQSALTVFNEPAP